MLKLIIISLISSVGFATSENIDSECRIQAKETAITAYQSCVKEARSQKIEEIRKEYQSKLQELKSYYDSEMKKMSPSGKSSEEKPAAEPQAQVTLKKKGKTAKGNGLPQKKIQGKSLPARNFEPEITTFSEESGDTEVVNIDENAI